MKHFLAITGIVFFATIISNAQPESSYTNVAAGKSFSITSQNGTCTAGECTNCGITTTSYSYRHYGFQWGGTSSWPLATCVTCSATFTQSYSVGTTTIQYRSRQITEPGNKTCLPAIDQTGSLVKNITITAVADLTVAATLPSLCNNGTPINVASYTNYADITIKVDGESVSGTTFTPSSYTPGTHTIAVSRTFTNGTTTITRNITILPVPVVTSTLPVERCSDAADVQLDNYYTTSSGTLLYSCVSGTCGSGMFYSSGNSAYLNPDYLGTATSYSATIRATVTGASNGCSATLDRTIQIGRTYTIDAGVNFDACKNAGAVSLSGTNSAGITGSWSGTAVNGNQFNPGNAGVIAGGSYTLTYTTDNTEGCVKTDTRTVTVNAAPALSLTTGSNTFCSATGTINLNTAYAPKDGTTSVTTGTWSSTTAAVNTLINNSTKTLNVTTLSGSYPLTFSYANAKSCTSTITQASGLVVNPTPAAPTITSNPSSPACGATAFLLTAAGGGGANQEYRWYTSGDGFLASGNAYATGSLSVGGPYTYKATVRNTATACESARKEIALTVSNLPNIIAPAAGLNVALCTGTGTINLAPVMATNPAGGTFSSTSTVIGSRLSGTTGASLNIAGIPAGAYPLRYTVTSGCTASVDVSLIFSTGVATPSVGDQVLCQPGLSTVLTVPTPDANAVYRWYQQASGGTSFYTGTSYTTEALNATATYYIEAVKGSCTSVRDQATVSVVAFGNVNAGPDLAFCNNQVIVSLDDAAYGVTPPGGAFSGANVTGTTFHGAGLPLNRAYTITYTVTDKGCTKSDERLVTLGFAPVLTIDPNDSVAVGQLVRLRHNYPNALVTRWDFGDGWTLQERDGTHYYYDPGQKTISLYVEIQQGALTCNGTFSFPQFVTVLGNSGIITGIENPSDVLNTVRVYPVPYRHGALTLESSYRLGPAYIELVSLMGKHAIARSVEVDSGATEVISDVEGMGLAPGAYVLLVRFGASRSLCFRIIKD